MAHSVYFLLTHLSCAVIILVPFLSKLTTSRSVHVRSASDPWSSPCAVEEHHPHVVNATAEETLYQLVKSSADLQDLLLRVTYEISSTYFQEVLNASVESLPDNAVFNFTDTPTHTETMYSDSLKFHYKSLYYYMEHVEHVCKADQALADQATLCAAGGMIDDVMTSIRNVICHIKTGLKGSGVAVNVVPRVGLSREFLKHDTNYTHEVIRAYKLADDGYEFIKDLNVVYTVLCNEYHCTSH